jgi:ketosteroid isomerase-like protein
MSRASVDLVRSMCDAYVAGDVAGALEPLHPEVVWHGTIGGLEEGRTYRGHAEVIAAFADSLADWERHSLETERFIDAGESVVVFWHETGRGRTSGVGVETRTAVVYTVRDGKVVEVQGYMDRADALTAVGLAEPT